AMASAVEKLTALGNRLEGVCSVSVLCRFSSDPGADLEEMAANCAADVVVIDTSRRDMAAEVTSAPVLVVDESPAAGAVPGTAPLVCAATDSRSGRTAVLLAAALCQPVGGPLTVIAASSRRRLSADLAPVSDLGVRVTVTGDADLLVIPGTLVLVADDATTPGAGPATLTVAPAYTVIDHTGTSEQSIAERIGIRFAGRGPGTAVAAPPHPQSPESPSPQSPSPQSPPPSTASPERH
ncbi:MAG: cation/H(+) antiporter, partial [Gordonia polyisoprenivorans]|nr:cation/H(+) antiporter [Gordonia polyisoprenivorans]